MRETDKPVKKEQDGQHGLVNVAVADSLIEQEAGVSNHWLQGVLSHDVVQLVCVQVLVHQLVAELAEVTDTGAGWASWQPSCCSEALAGRHGLVASVSQVQAAAAAVQADGRAAVIFWHLERTGGWKGKDARQISSPGWRWINGRLNSSLRSAVTLGHWLLLSLSFPLLRLCCV